MKLDKNTILFNAGGGLAVLIVAAYFVKTNVFPEKAPPCSTTDYPAVTMLPLERTDGELFTAADVQARLAGRDHGVIDYSKVIRVRNVKTPVLEVSLPKGSLSPKHTAPSKGGVSFQWRPTGMDKAKSACLSYQIWLPVDFDFKKGGTLPGLYGAIDGNHNNDDKTQFAGRFMWREGGALELVSTLPNANGEPRTVSMDPDFFRLPVLRWTSVEQEIVLNTLGKKDGMIRVWMNGELVVNRTQLELSNSDSVLLAGVQADVYYGGSDSSFSSPKDTSVRLTQFEVRTR